MEGDQCDHEKQQLLSRLLDAVKQCQVRFGGRGELATEWDSRVTCLCTTWETALQHGMKHNNKALSALKQMTELTGLAKMKGVFRDIRNLETEPVFWYYVREYLNCHELERFNLLKHINTDAGRGRAWLRSTLNEHSLEKYAHILTENGALLDQYYEEWAFLRDQERSSMLPMMAAGLNSILFAINIDSEALSTIRPAQGVQIPSVLTKSLPILRSAQSEPQPVIAGDESPSDRRKEQKKKKKKLANIVSFDDDDGELEIRRPKIVPANTPSKYQRQLVLSSTQKHTDESVATEQHLAGNGMSSDLIRLHREESQVSLGGSYTSTDFELQSSLSNVPPKDLTPIAIDGSSLFMSDTQSVDSSDMPSYGCRDTEYASIALAIAQQAGSPGYRTEGDGMTAPDTPKHETMSTDDLKQAVVAMMLQKDEVENENRSLRAALDQEIGISAGLQIKLLQLQDSHEQETEKILDKLKAATRENELLRQQLKKYVNAVQMLRKDSDQSQGIANITLEDMQPSIPPPRINIDYAEEASEYERKLVQVAEMHGELMEFNEHLHKLLGAKDAYIKRLKQELVDLRGPLPKTDSMMADDISINSDSTTTASCHPLINVWIPSAFLRGTGSDGFHVYQIYIRIGEEEWNVYRRYTQFHDLHKTLKKAHPIVHTFNFPPKKTLGNKDNKFVEARRKELQKYLRLVINYLIQNNQELLTSACKQKLLELLSFFGDLPIPDKSRKFSSTVSTNSNNTPSSGQEHYTGL